MRFSSLSIRKKLVAIILSIISVMLIIGFVSIGLYSVRMIMKVKTSEAESMTNLIGEYSITALAFNYPDRGNEILSKLENDPNIIYCYLYDSNGHPFSEYVNPSLAKQEFPSMVSTNDISFAKGNEYHLFKRIVYEDNFYGYIYLCIHTNYYMTVLLAVALFMTIFAILIFISYLIAQRMQKFISVPILKLAHTANQISLSGEYSIRIEKQTNDEIGLLYDEFNSLLSEIQKREKERDQAQDDLRNREQWIHTIINNLNDAVFVHDVENGDILFVNDTTSKLYGYEKANFYTMTVADLSINDTVFNQQKAIEIIERCYAEGPQIYEWLAKRKDGSIFWAEINMRRARLDGKERIMAVVRNIDERKKHQRELNSLQNYLQDIIDFMPSIIIGTDNMQNINQWNHQATEFTNLSPMSVIGRKLNQFDTGFPPLEHSITKAINDLEVIELQKVVIFKDDLRRYFNITIYPISSSNTSGVVIRLDDVTEQVQMEEMMIQSEKMMSVGGLAAGMAHEINNPLAGMMQNAIVALNRITTPSPKAVEAAKKFGLTFESVRDYLESRSITKQLQLIHDSGIRASNIIANMLSFARKSEDKFGRVDLCEVMDVSIDLAQNDYDLKKKFDFRKIIINRQYQENMDTCLCDAGKIEQVFINLLKNGAHAMNTVEERDSKFIIRIFQTEDSFVIEIEDNGTGIPDVVKKRIFEPFFTTKEVGSGTGLGLSVSYFIITDNHKGQMFVSSKDGEGTKFTIKLPR